MSSDLWSFSVFTYSRRGVERACLQLQSAGVNVCLLLCGLWLEERGVTCNKQRLQLLRDVAVPWDADVVQPLRALRLHPQDLTQIKEMNRLDPGGQGRACREASARLLVGGSRAPQTASRIAFSAISDSLTTSWGVTCCVFRRT